VQRGFSAIAELLVEFWVEMGKIMISMKKWHNLATSCTFTHVLQVVSDWDTHL